MDKELFINIYNKNGQLNANRTTSSYINNNFKQIYDLLYEENMSEQKFKEKLYCYIFNIKEVPKCQNPNCNNENIFYKFSRGYSYYCSSKCAYENFGNNKEALHKISESHINLRNANLLEKFKNLNLNLSIKKDIIILNNYCVHNNVTLSISDFKRNLYHGAQTHCKKCKDFYNKTWKPTSQDIEEQYVFFTNLIIKSKYNLTEKRISNYFPKLYKSIIEYSKMIKNTSWPEKVHIFKEKITKRSICINCKINEVHFIESVHQYSKHCKLCCDNKDFLIDYKNFVSKKEKEVLNYIEKIYTGNIIKNKRIQNNELDILIPELNIAFEFNGLYWHSEIYRNKEYHFNKLKVCQENNIKLMNIWEDDWNYKQDLIKSMIKNKLMLNENTIYARKCEIQIVNYKDAKDFLDKNHIQGNAQSKFNLGLYYQNNLVSLMTFCKKRMIMKSKSVNDDEYELLRFCSVQNTSIIGSASKLFNYFIKTYDPKIIVSYADLDISDGNLYRVLGFNEINHSLNYWWAKDKRYHRSNFMKHKLVAQGADPSLTEDEIMRSKGYMKIWGTGNLKFVWKSHEYIE